MAGVIALVNEALQQGKYIGSEWCDKDGAGPVAACDSYVLQKKEWNTYALKDLSTSYFIKLAINKLGTAVLLVSCHPPEK